jgi:glycerophosphoryl diester phosphodiesterase
MLLEDLCSLIARGTAHPEALLQLDYKEDETVLDARAIENFTHAIKPVARTIIVSSGSAQAVKMFGDAVPGIRIGYDPSDEQKFKAALRASSLGQFVADANAASPDAKMIYLDWEMVTVAADAGFDIVDAFQQQGKRIDAWTIPTVDDASVAVAERLLALKVDQITTDDPEGLADALSER